MRVLNKILVVVIIMVLSLPGLAKTKAMQEFSIIAKKYEYFPNKIIVKKDIPARIYLTSIDVAHHINIKSLGIISKVTKGKIYTIDFIPKKEGRFEFKCNIYCGTGHKKMKGQIIVIDKREKEINEK